MSRPPARPCACGCPATLAPSRRAAARYATDACRYRARDRRKKGQRHAGAVYPCAYCGDPIVYTPSAKGGGNGRRYHTGCKPFANRLRKKIGPGDPVAATLGWTPSS